MDANKNSVLANWGWRGGMRFLPESGFIGLMGFSGFRFAQTSFFAITENPASPNTDKRPLVKDARLGNPENPIIPQILILTETPTRRATL